MFPAHLPEIKIITTKETRKQKRKRRAVEKSLRHAVCRVKPDAKTRQICQPSSIPRGGRLKNLSLKNGHALSACPPCLMVEETRRGKLGGERERRGLSLHVFPQLIEGGWAGPILARVSGAWIRCPTPCGAPGNPISRTRAPSRALREAQTSVA